MLRWRPSALYSKSTERQIFLQDILLFVLGAHLLLLIVMVCASMFGSKHDRYLISMHQTGATYVLMPLQKKVEQPKQAPRSGNDVDRKSKVINYEDYQRRKNVQKPISKKAAATAKIAAVSQKNKLNQKMKKQNRATTALVDDHKSSVFKKESLDKNKKKNTVKMVEAVIAQQTAVQKIEEPLIIPDPTAKGSQAQEIIAADVVASNSLSEQSDSKETLEPFDVDNVVFVGYEQLDECVVGSKIQHSIQQCWTPPIGISAGTMCQMRVTISDQGVARSATIEKGSGVLVYDKSAQAALLQVEYPKEVYSKTITIVLGN